MYDKRGVLTAVAAHAIVVLLFWFPQPAYQNIQRQASDLHSEYNIRVLQADPETVEEVGRPDFQTHALSRFAASLAADPQSALLSWRQDSHPCGNVSNTNKPWSGVTCDAPTGYITAIVLKGKGLKGRLPHSFAVLKSLRTLDISNNSFEGQLPSSWSNLTSLETFDVSNNRLTGILPPTYSSWSGVQHVDLHGNRLSGPLPATWASMNLLQVLQLSHNLLTSTLPPSWARMGYLSVLNLGQNNLEGTLPPAWAEQRSLLQLNVGGNKIEGALPPQWAAGMDSLRAVNASGNALQGSLPFEWSNMTSLQVLSVDKNQLTGSIPPSWRSLHNLYAVNVTSNEGLCGKVPTGIAGVMDYNTTNLNTQCPWMEDASRLLAFKAVILDPFHSMHDWRHGSNPCGTQPWAGLVCGSSWVVAIRLQNRGLAGPLTPDLVKVSHLVELRLSGNSLAGTVPGSWSSGAAVTLTTIDLSNNTLTGTLPRVWSNLTSLSYVDLSNNKLWGELPPEWAGLTQLTTLLLSSNRGLNGSLPASWSNLNNLRTVYLNDGNLSGRLPASWGKLSQLREMKLSSNALTGTVPERLAELAYLDLSHNQLLCGSRPHPSGNTTLLIQRTSLGLDCSMLGHQEARLSGIRGLILGVCLGVVGSAVLSGMVYLIMRRRTGREQCAGHYTIGPTTSRHASCVNSAPVSPVPSCRSGAVTPHKGLHTTGGSLSPVTAQCNALSPSLNSPMRAAGSSFVSAQSSIGASNPQVSLSPAQWAAAGLLGASSGTCSRPMSPLGAPAVAFCQGAENADNCTLLSQHSINRADLSRPPTPSDAGYHQGSEPRCVRTAQPACPRVASPSSLTLKTGAVPKPTPIAVAAHALPGESSTAPAGATVTASQQEAGDKGLDGSSSVLNSPVSQSQHLVTSVADVESPVASPRRAADLDAVGLPAAEDCVGIEGRSMV